MPLGPATRIVSGDDDDVAGALAVAQAMSEQQQNSAVSLITRITRITGIVRISASLDGLVDGRQTIHVVNTGVEAPTLAGGHHGSGHAAIGTATAGRAPARRHVDRRRRAAARARH